MGRYGTRGRGISSGELIARMAAQDRRERYEQSPERVAFRRQVREIQLRVRADADPADGRYTAADIAHARRKLHEMGATPVEHEARCVYGDGATFACDAEAREHYQQHEERSAA